MERAAWEKKGQIINMNLKRAFTTTAILLLVIPLFGLRIFLYQQDSIWNQWVLLFDLGLEGVFLFFLIIDLILKTASIPVKYYLGQVQFTVLILGLTAAGCIDYMALQSMLLFMAAGGCYIFAPILNRQERRLQFSAVLLLILIWSVVCSIPWHMSIDLILMGLICVVLASYQHTFMRRFLQITGRLKKSTISSEHDALTGLLNRRALDAKIELIWPQCMKRAISVSVIELDIDYFKQYNDTFGHPKGDDCIQKIAEVLTNTLIDQNAIITRTGGEEFLIVLQDVEKRQLIVLGNQLRRNVEKLRMKHAYQEISDYVTISIGMASGIPTPEMTFEQLYESADQSLYLAKKSGRNCLAMEQTIYGKTRKEEKRIFQ